MTSLRQIEANRRNAVNSTGPRTPEGKAVVARNALKHGLLSRELLVRGEHEADLSAFAGRLRACLARPTSWSCSWSTGSSPPAGACGA